MNKKSPYIIDTILILILMGIIIFFANPLYLWMPDGAEIAIVAVFGVAFSLFAAFFWREMPSDEREMEHSQIAGKVAFIVGTSTLAIGIIYESLMHTLCIWLPLALTAMVLSKTITVLYLRAKK